MHFSGKKVSGDGIGKKIGFPTINIFTKTTIPSGVFAVWCIIKNKKYSALLHSGKRPTLKKDDFRCEVHVLDFEEDLPEGENISIEIQKKIRNVKKFSDIQTLQEQIKKDKEYIQK